jgi:hypothetical protein
MKLFVPLALACLLAGALSAQTAPTDPSLWRGPEGPTFNVKGVLDKEIEGLNGRCSFLAKGTRVRVTNVADDCSTIITIVGSCIEANLIKIAPMSAENIHIGADAQPVKVSVLTKPEKKTSPPRKTHAKAKTSRKKSKK